MLLVASGESDTFIGLPRVCPDLTLYIDDAGMFVISGLRFPGMVLRISICLMAMSRDFLERFLPNPALSGDEDFADKLP